MSHKHYRIFEKNMGFVNLWGELYIESQDIAALFFDFKRFWEESGERDAYVANFEKRTFRFFYPNQKRRSVKVKFEVNKKQLLSRISKYGISEITDSPESRYTFERLFFKCYNDCFKEILLPRNSSGTTTNKSVQGTADRRPRLRRSPGEHMRRDHVDQRKLYFILVRNNMACAFVQKGQDEDDLIVEIIDHTVEKLIDNEIEKCLLTEPESAYMASVGRWDYMKDYCFKSMNLYGAFMWAYYEPHSKEIQCGFSVHIRNLNLDKDNYA